MTPSGLLQAALAAFFVKTVDGLLALLLGRFLFLTEAFLYGAVTFLIIELAEIVGFAFPQTGTLPGGGILFHVSLVCCFTTVVIGKGTVKQGEKLDIFKQAQAKKIIQLVDDFLKIRKS